MGQEILRRFGLNGGELSGCVERLKTVGEWMESAVDAVKDNADFASWLSTLTPWAGAVFEATKDAVAPVKFLVKLFEELTAVQEPEALARLASTLAYQAAAAKAFAACGAPGGAMAGLRARGAEEDVEFSAFTLESALTHPFVRASDRVVEYYAGRAGFSDVQVTRITAAIHDTFQDELSELISHAKTKERFDPLMRWLKLDADGRAGRAALRRHGEYVGWLHNEAAVLQRDPYALKHIYVETDCGVLTRGQIEERAKRNPFSEEADNGGRQPLLDVVMARFRDAKFNEPIVIQGTAGSGKSSFTLRLADELRREGLRPIRIRLRDVRIEKEFFEALSGAVALEDENFLRACARWPAVTGQLLTRTLFHEEVRWGAVTVCPYVLILDGWDEISVSVSEGFKLRVRDLLMNVRRELFGSGPRVRVVLTGRPSDAIDDCADFYHANTPVLTVRPLSPGQLESFSAKLQAALAERPVVTEETVGWAMPGGNYLGRILGDYAAEVKVAKEGARGVFGTPFLAQLAFRVIGASEENAAEVMSSDTALLRRLTDLTVRDAHRPSDVGGNDKVLQRVAGADLRKLLRRTAAEMTVAGRESISRAELQRRLKVEDLDERIRKASKDHVLTALVVSFYFKGGNPALGCEFTHKALREYLFAEEVVETLKEYGRRAPAELPEREPYWAEFGEQDPRHGFVRALANLLAPQWMSREVAGHLEGLIEWEVRRSLKAEHDGADGSTTPLTIAQWRIVRDGLADAWDWWGEGVHLRPQVKVDSESEKKSLAPALVHKLVDRFLGEAENDGVPMRFTSLDSHLGEALMHLCVLVHWDLMKKAKDGDRLQVRKRGQYQSEIEGIRFRPSGAREEYFRNYCSRINGGGWRLQGRFAAETVLWGVDLERTWCEQLAFFGADLREAKMGRAVLNGANFSGAGLRSADFSHSMMVHAYLEGARLEGANFASTLTIHAKFSDGMREKLGLPPEEKDR